MKKISTWIKSLINPKNYSTLKEISFDDDNYYNHLEESYWKSATKAIEDTLEVKGVISEKIADFEFKPTVVDVNTSSYILNGIIYTLSTEENKVYVAIEDTPNDVSVTSINSYFIKQLLSYLIKYGEPYNNKASK